MSNNRLLPAARMVFAIAAVIAFAVLPMSATATAATAAEPTPAEEIADALRESPVYVHPAIAPALPEKERKRIAGLIRNSDVPIYVILTPLVRGDAWNGDPNRLALLVHDRLGKDGVYVTFDQQGAVDLTAREWGGDHHAKFAAWTPGFEDDLDNAPLADHLARCVELIASGKGKQAYDKATADLGAPSTPSPASHAASDPDKSTAPADGGGGGGITTFLLVGLVIVVLAGGAIGLLLWRRNRPAATADPFGLPRTVFDNARRMSEQELREQARREVVAFGELLDKTDLKPDTEEARTDLTGALDGYSAATKTLDQAHGVPDLAGVLVLVDQGRDRLEAARARTAKQPVPAPSPLCFFNPLHGDAARQISWRPVGSRDRLEIRACSECADRTDQRQLPDMLTDQVDGRTVPYYEVPSEVSLWSATGYGAFDDDLAGRILRGELRRT